MNEVAMTDTVSQEVASTARAWVVVITTSLFFFYAFIQMNFFNAINAQLTEAFHLNAQELGQLFSMYFYANALFLFPVGNLVDRFSTRKLLLAAISVSTLGTFVFAEAQQYWVAAMGRFLVGAGAAFCFLASIRVASRWFPPAKMAFVTGIVVTLAMLGGLVAQTPFSFLVAYLGNWREAVLLDGMLGILILAAVFFIVEDRPPNSHEEHAQHHRQLKELGLWRCIKLAALNPQNWFGGLYTALINLPVFILGGLWGIRYLDDVHNMTAEQASYATTIFFVGVIIGSPLYGWVSDHIERRVLPMIVGAILSLLTFIILLYVPDLSLFSIVALFFMMGVVTSSQVLSYPTIAELNPIYLTSTAISIDSMCIMISGFIFPPFFGWLIDRSGAHEVVNGITVYSPAAFDHAMLIMPLAFVAALVIAFFIRETNCCSQV